MSSKENRPEAGARRPDDDLDAPKADRPGGPGQSAQNPVAPGDATPAPDPRGGEGAPEQDDAVKARREHLRDED